ncbi:hypothetical protein LXL04_029922 [Taraxacum kok-saghyz]
MELQGISRNVVTYNTLIDGLCKNRRAEEAAMLMDQMIIEGLKPDKFTYNSILSHFCKMGDIKRATDTVQVMITNGCEPDIVTYGTLIQGLCKAGKIDVACRLLRSIQGYFGHKYEHGNFGYLSIWNPCYWTDIKFYLDTKQTTNRFALLYRSCFR